MKMGETKIYRTEDGELAIQQGGTATDFVRQARVGMAMTIHVLEEVMEDAGRMLGKEALIDLVQLTLENALKACEMEDPTIKEFSPE